MKKTFSVKQYFLLDINVVIRTMITSDLMFMGGASLLAPIFALFVEDSVIGASPAVIGTGMAIYLVTKSVMQIPAAAIIDKIKGERDDYIVLQIGTVLAALMPLSYLFMTLPWHLYLVQMISGLILAFTFPSYMAIFTRHIDHEKEGMEWGVYYTTNDFVAAIAASVGGYVAETLGYNVLIWIVAFTGLIGAAILAQMRNYMYMPVKVRKSKKRR